MQVMRWAARAKHEFYEWHVWTKGYLLFGLIFGFAMNQPDCGRCLLAFIPFVSLVAAVWATSAAFWFMKWHYEKNGGAGSNRYPD